VIAIAGYASLFGVRDLGGDVVARGAFRRSLARRGAARLGMLDQHVTASLIGVWDVAREDATGLFVRGRIIEQSAAAILAATRVRAGTLDGLSIGFVARAARPDPTGRGRLLTEIDLFEVSLVSCPMLPGARLTVVSSLPDVRRAA
jgi:HK97 family phage prohead protease